jgi:hypothetical protein
MLPRHRRVGGLALVDLETLVVERFDVGGPVLAVAFDPSGAKLFGILDEQACEPLAPCRGAFAFDVVGRRRLPTTDAAPMQIPGSPRGIAVGGSATIAMPVGEPITVSPLVMVSSTDGSLYLIDGGTERPILVSAAPSVREQYLLDENDVRTDNPAGGPADIALAEGAARPEQLTVTYQGVLPSLSAVSGTLSAGLFEAEASGTEFAALDAREGDIVVVTSPQPLPGGPAVPTEAVVAAVDGGQLSLTGLDPACAGVVTVAVRAADYLVLGTVSGNMGRVRAGEAFAYAGTYRFEPTGFDPTRPAVAFQMGEGRPVRDSRYVLEISATEAPLVYRVLPRRDMSMPGAITYSTRTDVERFYVVYLGGNALAEIKPDDLRHDQLTPQGQMPGAAIFL